MRDTALVTVAGCAAAGIHRLALRTHTAPLIPWAAMYPVPAPTLPALWCRYRSGTLFGGGAG